MGTNSKLRQHRRGSNVKSTALKWCINCCCSSLRKKKKIISKIKKIKKREKNENVKVKIR